MAKYMIGLAQLEGYNPNEDWENYQERMEHCFKTNDVKPDQQASALLALIGASTYRILKDLLAPAKPSTKTYAELVTALRDHFSPPTLTLAERFQFGIRNQKVGESITEFATALRALTAKCEFGTFLDDALSLRFVCGMRDKSTQKRLLLLKNPTFKEVLDTAVKCESADRHMEIMHDSTQEGSVLQFRGKPPNNNRENYRFKRKPKNNACFRCGRRNHTPDKCYFIDEKCRDCGEKGHIAKMCPKKAKSRGPFRNVRAMACNNDPDQYDDEPSQVNAKRVTTLKSNSLSTSGTYNRCNNPNMPEHELIHHGMTMRRGNHNNNYHTDSCLQVYPELAPAPTHHLSAHTESAATEYDVDTGSNYDNLNSIDRINNCLLNGSDSIYVTPLINGKQVKMELDTGSAVSIMNLVRLS